MRRIASITLVLFLLAGGTAAASDGKPPFAERVKNTRPIGGLVPLYWDADEGKLLLEVPAFDRDLLYQVSLAAGLGSNPIGLDRGQLGSTHLVRFVKVGPRVLLVESNTRFRAISDDPRERMAVEDSFARSVLWGFREEAREGGRVLVDATPFFLRDAHGVIDRLRATDQGNYTLDDSRSAIHLDKTRGFPRNTEVEAIVTFTTNGDSGPLVRSVAPAPKSITLRQHHSFVALPEEAFEPRPLDPRVSTLSISFHDYASPIDEPIAKRWIVRHRLEKKDRDAAVSDVVRPIVYYLDPGTPEPVRSALLDGASWWKEAFERAGFRNAFEVRMLPDDADPMDIRYNMIHWVHRSTRGWSYGGSVIDPRTGEIIKGNVLLGSLRVRQDHLINTALTAPFTGGHACALGLADDFDAASFDPSADASAMALDRLRQLSAHEVGHAIGFDHNFAASTYGRESVMDYPAPLVTLHDGKIDLSNAYMKRIGEYDVFTVRYAYSQFPPGSDEQGELRGIVHDAYARGLTFVSDGHARGAGTAHPAGSLWDNGSDPVEALRQAMEVRALALSRFGLANIPTGSPLSMLETKLVPLYLYHRFQLQAAGKLLGGVEYAYSVKEGDSVHPAPDVRIVPPSRQRAALEAIVATLDPRELTLPARLLEILPPPAYEHEGGSIELFDRRTSPAFDAIGIATVASRLTLDVLLDPARAARLVEHDARNDASPGFDEVLSTLVSATWNGPAPKGRLQAAVARATQRTVADRLIDLASNTNAAPDVRAIAADALRDLAAGLRREGVQGIEGAHRRAVADDIERALSRPAPEWKENRPLATPAGEPIG